jgi:cell division septation protein DedD
MAFFVICLVALGLSFFFGLMAGLSRREPVAEGTPAAPTAAASAEAPPEPTAPAPKGTQPPSKTRLANEAVGDAAAPAPTAPAVLTAFGDQAPEEPTPAPASSSAVRAPGPAVAGVWIQVASLTARGEADALVARLSRRGFHAQIAQVPGPKGKLYRVRVGPYRTEDDARRSAAKLRQTEKIGEPWIVRDGH